MSGLIDPSEYRIGPAVHDNCPEPGMSHLESECPGGDRWPCSAFGPKSAYLKTALRQAMVDFFGPLIDRYVDEHWPADTYAGSPSQFVEAEAPAPYAGRIEDFLGFWSRQPESMYVDRSPDENRVSGIELNWWSVSIDDGTDWEIL